MIAPLLLSPSGGPCDVAWHEGVCYVAWQDGPGPDARLVLRGYRPSGVVVSTDRWKRQVSVTFPLGSDVGAFPRLLSALGSLWLIYREGKSLGGQAVLRRDGVEVWRSDGECGGNDPVAIGTHYIDGPVFAWQQAGTNQILSARAIAPTRQLPDGMGRPTGLSHIRADGVVMLVDDVRGAVAGMTRPCWSGALVAGEHPDSGALVRVVAS